VKYFKIERTMTPHPARGLRGNVHGLLDLTALHINPMKRWRGRGYLKVDAFGTSVSYNTYILVH
jgi:hypothetical protein